MITLLESRTVNKRFGGLQALTDVSLKIHRGEVYGLLLVALMLARPQGLFGTREIWEVLPRWIPRRRKGM